MDALAPAFVFALACAALIGLAAHRASLCNVRAVAELMRGGTAHMLGSLMQAALWMALLTGGLALLAGREPPRVLLGAPAAWALAGGWLFGAGAALNGGCSLSTLHRLADGELGMLGTLAGFASGVLAWAAAASLLPTATLLPVDPVWTRWPALAPWLLAALGLWALWRLAALYRLARGLPLASLRERLLAPRYPLPVAAAMMGLAGGLLYATQGAWSYTNHLRTSLLHAWSGGHAPVGTHTALVAALQAGMLFSALQRGTFVLQRPAGRVAWLRHIGGGVLMGAGAAMVPGGNDTLLLNALPTLALQATAAYLSMLAGIATVLWSMRRARVAIPDVRCTPVGCAEVDMPPGP